MQTLLEVQQNFNWIGLSPKLNQLNHVVLRILILNFLGVFSLWIYLIHVPDSPQEYMESIFVVTASTGISLSYTSTIFIRKKLYLFFNGVNVFYSESKWNFDQLTREKYEFHKINSKLIKIGFKSSTSKATLSNTNKFVEKYSKIGMLFIKFVFTLGYISPKVIISFFIYFTTDAGNDAFNLPLPMW